VRKNGKHVFFMACFVNLGCFEHNECDEER
jgi:hypothetical protein